MSEGQHLTLCGGYRNTMSSTEKGIMQHVFDEVAKRLTSKDPDSDQLLDLLAELRVVEVETSPENWRQCLKNVAAAYGLVEPECLK